MGRSGDVSSSLYCDCTVNVKHQKFHVAMACSSTPDPKLGHFMEGLHPKTQGSVLILFTLRKVPGHRKTILMVELHCIVFCRPLSDAAWLWEPPVRPLQLVHVRCHYANLQTLGFPYCWAPYSHWEIVLQQLPRCVSVTSFQCFFLWVHLKTIQ